MPAVPKKVRLHDRQAVKDARKPCCEFCGAKAWGGAHHIVSQGSGGPDFGWNLIQLCKIHHTEVHQTGLPTKRQLFEIIAQREGVDVDTVEQTVRELKV